MTRRILHIVAPLWIQHNSRAGRTTAVAKSPLVIGSAAQDLVGAAGSSGTIAIVASAPRTAAPILRCAPDDRGEPASTERLGNSRAIRPHGCSFAGGSV